MPIRILYSLCLLITISSLISAADWNQWRGSNRDGVAADSPALISKLPETGLTPIWTANGIGSGKNDGGWGSPVVITKPAPEGSRRDTESLVYLFTHKRIKFRDVPKKKYPWLPPEKRVGMTPEQYAEYEVKRRDEDEFIAQSYRHIETVLCLDGHTGQERWKNERKSFYSRFPQSGSPTVVDGRLYILGAGRHARCINAANGDDLWSVRLEGDFRDEFWQSSFVIVDNLAIFLAGHLFALDTKNGKVLWEGDAKLTRGTHTSPVLWKKDGKQFVVVNVNGSETICVEPATGKELWRIKSEGGLSTPVIAGDRLLTYGNSRKKGLRSFQMTLEDAKHEWTFNGAADKGSSPVVVGDHVFVQGEKRLACVDLASGKACWQVTIDYRRPQYISLIAADKKVYYALEGLLCFNASGESFEPLIDGKIDDTGWLATEAAIRKKLNLDKIEQEPNGQAKAEKLYQSKIGRHGPVPCVTPAFADGFLYVRLKNSVVCYDLRDRQQAAK